MAALVEQGDYPILNGVASHILIEILLVLRGGNLRLSLALQRTSKQVPLLPMVVARVHEDIIFLASYRNRSIVK